MITEAINCLATTTPQPLPRNTYSRNETNTVATPPIQIISNYGQHLMETQSNLTSSYSGYQKPLTGGEPNLISLDSPPKDETEKLRLEVEHLKLKLEELEKQKSQQTDTPPPPQAKPRTIDFRPASNETNPYLFPKPNANIFEELNPTPKTSNRLETLVESNKNMEMLYSGSPNNPAATKPFSVDYSFSNPTTDSFGNDFMVTQKPSHRVSDNFNPSSVNQSATKSFAANPFPYQKPTADSFGQDFNRIPNSNQQSETFEEFEHFEKNCTQEPSNFRAMDQSTIGSTSHYGVRLLAQQNQRLISERQIDDFEAFNKRHQAVDRYADSDAVPQRLKSGLSDLKNLISGDPVNPSAPTFGDDRETGNSGDSEEMMDDTEDSSSVDQDYLVEWNGLKGELGDVQSYIPPSWMQNTEEFRRGQDERIRMLEAKISELEKKMEKKRYRNRGKKNKRAGGLAAPNVATYPTKQTTPPSYGYNYTAFESPRSFQKKEPTPPKAIDQSAGLVGNANQSKCSICKIVLRMLEGICLRDCQHVFCRPCLVGIVNLNQKTNQQSVACPSKIRDNKCRSNLRVILLLCSYNFIF